MKDLIKRLRDPLNDDPYADLLLAADALEALKAELEELAALLGMKSEREEKYLAEIEALRADTDRLDWLEQNPRHAQIVVEGVPQSCVFYGITCSHLMKLREAIDAVRRK